MNKSGQNSIQTTVFELAYHNKAAAVQGNLLIESIFNAQVLPELENAITKKIPKNALLELSKLEIDIGTIDESRLKELLPAKIATAIDEALQNTTKINESLMNGPSENSGVEDNGFLLEALEFYLVKGYFPVWIDSSVTMQDIIGNLLSDDGDDLVRLLQKLGKHDVVTKRLAYGLNTKLFKRLLKATQPMNAEWINAVALTLLNIPKEEISTVWSRKEFIQQLHFFIFKNILNSKSVDFNRVKFLNNILPEIARWLNIESEVLLQHIRHDVTTNNSNTELKSTLEKLVPSTKLAGKATAANDLQIGQVLKFLNSSIFLDKSTSAAQLKNKIIEVLRNKDKRTVILKGLNEAGVRRVLELCFPKMAGDYLEIIKSFERWASKGENTTVFMKGVKATLLYLTESAVKELGSEEYIYFLVNATGSHAFKKTDDFKSFINEQKHVDLNKFIALAQNEHERTEIAKLWKLLSRSTSEKPSRAKGHNSKVDSSQEYFLIYSRKIVGEYLKEGQLKSLHFDLTQKDILWLFRRLLKHRDTYLVDQLQRLVDTNKITDRLDILCALDSSNKSEDNFLPSIVVNGSKKTKSYVYQLYYFISAPTIADEHKRVYKELLWNLVILSFLEKRQYTAKTFAVAFGQNLRKIFNEKNALGMLESMFGQMANSGNIILKELAKVLAQSKHKESKSNSEKSPFLGAFETDSQTKEASFYLPLFEFYIQNGFLPWWSGAASFSDLLHDIGKLDQKNVNILAEELDRLEEQEPFVKQLLSSLSFFEINALVRVLPQLNTTGVSLRNSAPKDDARNNKREASEINDGLPISDDFFNHSLKDKEALFKALYFLGDDQILQPWSVGKADAAKQAMAYTSLSPYFHFRELSPIRWRKMVYEFTLDFFGKGQQKDSGQYAGELLDHLKKNYRRIDWESVLSSVHQRIEDSEGQNPKIFPLSMAKLINRDASKSIKDHNDNTAIDDQAALINGALDIGVSNAGIILFWPFLTRFFEHFSLLKDGSFIDESCRYQAIYLLQYLAFNKINFPEHQLVLNKVLVGMSPHEVVLPLSRLSKEAKKISQSLLNGLIGNWEKLKDSSPEAIQETFLQREGFLSIKEESLLLKIDKKGVDVLLTSIPWNITLVKLPWMKKPLHVEWV